MKMKSTLQENEIQTLDFLFFWKFPTYVLFVHNTREAKSLSYFFACTFVFSIFFFLSFSSFVMSHLIELIQESIFLSIHLHSL